MFPLSGIGSNDGSATKSMKPKSPYSLRMFSRPLRSLAVENTSPLDIPNNGVIKASGVRKNLTPVNVMLFR